MYGVSLVRERQLVNIDFCTHSTEKKNGSYYIQSTNEKE